MSESYGSSDSPSKQPEDLITSLQDEIDPRMVEGFRPYRIFKGDEFIGTVYGDDPSAFKDAYGESYAIIPVIVPKTNSSE